MASAPAGTDFKIFAFCARAKNFTHEEYCYGHSSFHVSIGRRLIGVNGYLFNGRMDDRRVEDLVPELASELAIAEPHGVDDMWDGLVEWWSSSHEAYFKAIGTPIPDVPTKEGMSTLDPLAETTRDARNLFYGVPFQPAVRETVVVEVTRPEREIFKVLQMGRRAAGMPLEEFEKGWVDSCSKAYAGVPGVRGCTVNMRDDSVETLRGFFADWQVEYAESGPGRAERERFYSLWDGAALIYFDDARSFAEFQRSQAGAELRERERGLFDSMWLRQVRETIGRMPERID